MPRLCGSSSRSRARWRAWHPASAFAAIFFFKQKTAYEITVDAAVSSLGGQEADALGKLLDNPGTAARTVVPPRKGPGVASGRAGSVVPGMEPVNVNVITPTAAAAMARPGADAISMLAAAIARGRNAPSM